MGGNILPDIRIYDKTNPRLLHEGYPSVNQGFVKLHIGDAVPEQSADAVSPLIDRHIVPSHVQHLGSRKAGRSASDHGNLLSGTHS